jgi:hypothetical protein
MADVALVNRAMVSGYTFTLSAYDAIVVPSWVIMFVVPTVLRQYTLMLLILPSSEKMLDWQFSGPPPLEQAARMSVNFHYQRLEDILVL